MNEHQEENILLTNKISHLEILIKNLEEHHKNNINKIEEFKFIDLKSQENIKIYEN